MSFTKRVCITTGASQNHSKTLHQFLSSVDFEKFDCVVYDLGLEAETFAQIQRAYPLAYCKVFDYSKYPDYYNIHINAGEYAWKPAILKEVLDEIKAGGFSTEILLWCDAGDLIKNRGLDTLIPVIYENKVYSPISCDTLRRWTHPTCYKWFGIPSDSPFLNLINRAGGLQGYCITEPSACKLISDSAQCASIRECIAPIGSSRENHRQDQAVLTILYYRFFINNPAFKICNYRLDVSFYNDID
jgi:hypothetical protein